MITTVGALDTDQLARLNRYVDEHAPGLLPPGDLRARIIGDGRSNLTYLIGDETREVVLRRPPAGGVLATAHDMSREFRALTAMSGTPVPVPEPLLLCNDSSVIGAPFYLMSYVPGRVLTSPEVVGTLSRQGASAVSAALIDCLVDLHEVPAEAFGPVRSGGAAGFVNRQLDRWTGQLDAVRARPLPAVDALYARLAEDLPPDGPVTIVHGDFRLGNVVLDSHEPVIRAVLDWELTTIGDPLTDVGWLALSWSERGGPDGLGDDLGFLSQQEMIDRYCLARGVRSNEMPWYIAFSCFKLAVIREGIYQRYVDGHTEGEVYAAIGERVATVAQLGLQQLK